MRPGARRAWPRFPCRRPNWSKRCARCWRHRPRIGQGADDYGPHQSACLCRCAACRLRKPRRAACRHSGDPAGRAFPRHGR
ncbi:zinc finger domain-containing protein [Ensifer sp. ENS03]|uniref:zinc finger domain-containing protein n=1 Tax=Ensifer TaxID=106591 RepID=UPI00353018A0